MVFDVVHVHVPVFMTGRVGPQRTGSASLTKAGPTQSTVTKFAPTTVLGKIHKVNQFNPIAQAGGQTCPPLHEKKKLFFTKHISVFDFQII